MWKSFSKGLEKNWKAATKGISTAADKNFDKVSHGTYDKSDHWHSEYRDDGFIYDLKLRRNKANKNETAQTGRYKFSWQKLNSNEKHTSEGAIEYRVGELLLKPNWYLVQLNVGASDEVQMKFETNETLEEPRQGNGCYLVPPAFMDILCERQNVAEGELPTFSVEIRPPGTTKNLKTGEKIAQRGNTHTFEIYLPVSTKGKERDEKGAENSD